MDSSETSGEEVGASTLLRQDLLLAEIRKLNLESDEIEKKLNQKWYQPGRAINTLVGAAIAGAGFLVWVIAWYEPLMNARIQEKEIETTLTNLQLKLMTKENDVLKARINNLIAENVALADKLKTQSKKHPKK